MTLDALDAHAEPPARLQMIVALILGLVLVAIPLYLWRRPRAESIPIGAGGLDAGVLPAVTAATTGNVDEKLLVGTPKILSCHDPGPKRTPPEQCDRLPELEMTFAKAIEESASCVPREAGGGTIVYVADVSFKKRTVTVSTPKDARTLRSSKVAGSCEKAVRNKLSTLPLETITHEHARYRMAITTTYPGAVKPH